MKTPSRARWVAVVLCILYGFAKLNGSQFTVLDSELTKPMGAVSGFWLTWYYFGYSTVYGTVIALVQIGGAVLLAIRRTALLGALLLVPVFVNIILIDVFYGIDPGATLTAIVILACLVAVIAPHVARLRAAVLLDAVPYRLWPRLAAVTIVLASAAGFTWWTANYNNRLPIAIDGVWAADSPAEQASLSGQQVFFERNRAYWVVFRSASGDQRHHFEVDRDGVVRIWQTWLTKGALIMQGRVLQDGRLQLDGVGEGASHMLLHRQAAPR